MKKIGIITDSSACLNLVGFESKYVKIIDFIVNIDGIPHRISKLDIDMFYRVLRENKELPTTAITSQQEIIDMFNEFKDDGFEDVIVLTVSSKLSGSLNNVMGAIQEVDGINIHVIDTLTTAYILGDAVVEAVTMIEAGKSVEVILAELNRMFENDDALIYVDTLKNLVKGGRMSGAVGIVGEVFKIKPILRLAADGTVSPIAKFRTAKKAISRLIDMYKEKTSGRKHKLYILHSDNYEFVKGIAESIISTSKDIVSSIITGITPVISTHTGPGAFAISWRYV